MRPYRLAHLSDVHLGPLPPVRARELVSKRVFGYLNWLKNRAASMDLKTLSRLSDDLLRQAPDHVAVTGDLVNIALPAEFEATRAWLEALGPPEAVTVVPGNHDAYVPGALRRALEAWRPYVSGDGATPEGDPLRAFPFVRRRPPVALVGVSSAVATPPFWATGAIGAEQAEALRETLRQLGTEGLFRIVLVHHPPLAEVAGFRARLVDAKRMRQAVRAAGCELVLHGHLHRATVGRIKGPAGPVPVVGVPSASLGGHGGMLARYNLLEIDVRRSSSECTIVERGLAVGGGPVTEIGRRRLT